MLDLMTWSCEAGRCSLAAFLNKRLFFPRCVSDRQRSFALGIQWIVVRTLGMEQREFALHSGLVVLGPSCHPRIKHIGLEKKGVGHTLLKRRMLSFI